MTSLRHVAAGVIEHDPEPGRWRRMEEGCAVDEHVLHILLGFAGVGATFTVSAASSRCLAGEFMVSGWPEDRFRLTSLMVTSLSACPSVVRGPL
jgi:hypothetical protein